MKPIYFDNAATSWPKPPEMMRAMAAFNENIGANPGRSGHSLSVEAARVMMRARDALAALFGIADPLRIVFTKNATEGLNCALFSLFRQGGHVITSGMEHNSVMRPLRYLERHGVELSVVRCSHAGELDPADVKSSIRAHTRAIVMTHASNVTGTIMPVEEVGRIAREHEVLFCVDAAQSAGALPISVCGMHIDILAFTGHKSLYGPQGTGGMYIRPGLDKEITPLIMGGTGSASEFEEQPDFMPDRFESGTPNAIGIAGLGEGVSFVLGKGVHAIRNKERELTDLFLNGLADIDGITVYGPRGSVQRTSVVSFNIDGYDSSEVIQRLDEEFGICARPGLHCAPAAHKTIGTFPMGTCRFSFGYFNTEDEVKKGLEAIASIR